MLLGPDQQTPAPQPRTLRRFPTALPPDANPEAPSSATTSPRVRTLRSATRAAQTVSPPQAGPPAGIVDIGIEKGDPQREEDREGDEMHGEGVVGSRREDSRGRERMLGARLSGSTADDDDFDSGSVRKRKKPKIDSQEQPRSAADILTALERLEREGGPALRDWFDCSDDGDILPDVKTVSVYPSVTPSISPSGSSLDLSLSDTAQQSTPPRSPMQRSQHTQYPAFVLRDCSSSEASLQSLLEKLAPEEHKIVDVQPDGIAEEEKSVTSKPQYSVEEEAINSSCHISGQPLLERPNSLGLKQTPDEVIMRTERPYAEASKDTTLTQDPSPPIKKIKQVARVRRDRDFSATMGVYEKKSNVTARGAPIQPVWGKPFSQQVYLWNYETKKRSERWIPLEQAIAQCKVEHNGKLAIYDGQDYDFNSGLLSSRAVYFKTENGKWVERDTKYLSHINEKTRLWSDSLQAMRAHRYTPLRKNLRQWLTQNLDFAVFQPSLLNPTCVPSNKDSMVESMQQMSDDSPSRLSHFIRRRVLPLVRQSRILEIREEDRIALHTFWNKKKACIEGREVFPSRHHLITFLLKNPWIEVDREQAKVDKFEIENGYKLIPLMMNCPAQLACFWDKQSKEKLIRPSKDARFADKTVYECLSKNSNLELYLGQDTELFSSILEIVRARRMSGCFPYPFMFAYCGERVAKFFASSEWTATYFEVSNCTTAAALFWKRNDKNILMQPEMTSFVSIEDYLAGNSGIELYIGQDKTEEFRQEIDLLFDVMSYKPGCSHRTHRRAITKRSFMPLSVPSANLKFSSCPTAKISGENKEAPNHLNPFLCVAAQEHDPDDNSASQPTAQHKSECPERQRPQPVEHLLSEQNQHLAEPNIVVAVDNDIVRQEPRTVGLEKNDNRSNPSQDTTNCSEENLDELSPTPCSPSPVTSAGQDPDLYEDSSESDYSSAPCDREEPAFSLPLDERLRKARDSSIKVAQAIKEAGPKILNRQLVSDLRQSIREDLIVEVPAVKELIALSKRFRSLDFIEGADELCKQLEEVDVYKCFTDVPDFGQEPPDLSSLRTSLESGSIFTISGMIQEFRYISEDLIQFHQDGVLHNEAVIIQCNGEKAIELFVRNHQALVEEEEKIIRIGVLCEKGKKIGFISNERGNRTKRASNLSHRKVKPAIRVSGCQSEVTLLNYRDKKGHSVMGKRNSARIFGVSIDRRACEYKIGNVRECHICGKKVFQSDGDALRCTNSAVGLCQEVVCRNCLVTVFRYGEIEFVESRQADNWLCVHCVGLCGSSGRCKGSNQLPQSAHPKRDVLFEWPSNDQSVSICSAEFARRQVNGEFQSWDDAAKVDLILDTKRRVWYAEFKFPVGLYRFKIITNGEWYASSTFLVSPFRKEPEPVWYQQLRRRIQAGYNHTNEEESSTGFAPDRDARLIRWRVSPNHECKPVHGFCEGEGGDTIKLCSRTDGYDWRRSKRHAVVQWLPQQMETNMQALDKTRGQKLKPVFSASSVGVANSFQRPGFPKMHVGMSYESFQKALNAHRFDHISETLWGIVAGKSDIHGIGLFTLTGYRKGDYVIEYAGELIRSPLADLREARYEDQRLEQTYFFRIDEHYIVDATVKSNRARFTNHSCDPNMAAEIVHVRGRNLVVLLATRDIPRFSELTFNYQLPYEDRKVQCLCSAWNCIGVMN